MNPAGLGPYALNSIVTGDNAEVMAQLPAGCIDLTVTSPPYDNLRAYNGYEWDFEAVASQLWRVTKEGGVVVWVVADATINGSETGTSFRQALHFMELGFRLHDTMIYERHPLPLTHNRYEQHFEYMFVFSKGRPATFNPITVPTKHAGEINRLATHAAVKGERGSRHGNGNNGTWRTKRERIKGNVWYMHGGYGITSTDGYAHNHPAVFPEALAHDHIVSWSNPGDLVLDPFCGSGTTLKMALLAGRHFIGIDISPEYVDLARRRVAEAAARTPEALANGRAKPGGKVDTAGLPLFEALL